MYTMLWLTFFFMSLFIEVVASPGLFYFLAVSFGSLSATLVSYLEWSTAYQLMAFITVTFLSFLLLRKCLSYISKDTLHKSNVYALQGQKGVVTETISSCKRGWIKINGELWSASAIDDTLILAGEMVEVVSSAGSHLKVRKSNTHC